MSSRFSDQDRAQYRDLVAILLPAAHGLPAGNEVDVAGAGLDRVARLRPEIVGDVLRGIRLFGSGGLAAVQADADAWRAVRLAAFAAYFLAPAVMEKLGYAGQKSHPFDPDVTPDYVLDGSLQRVIDRGPIWAAPPA